VDPALDDAMAAVRQIVELGRRVRTETRVRVRQPLLEAVVHYAGDHAALEPMLDLVAEELNVRRVLFAESAEGLGRWRAKPNFKVLGPRLGRQVKAVAAALERDDGSLAAAIAHGDPVRVDLGTERIELAPSDVDLVQETVEGWGVASDGGITVALELELTPELRAEGLARELVRAVQDARKAGGLDVGDRIVLGLQVEGPALAEALEAHRAWIAAETLAVEIVDGTAPDATFEQTFQIEGARVEVGLRRA